MLHVVSLARLVQLGHHLHDYSTNMYCTCKPGLEASICVTNDHGNKSLLPRRNLKCPKLREVITSHCHRGKISGRQQTKNVT